MSYMTRDEMIAAFAAYQTNYPNLVKSEVVGQTVDGLNLRLYKIGNPANGPVMFSAGTHGFERAAVEVLKLFVDWVLTSNDAEAVRIRQRNYVLVLPCLDLDGYPNASGMNKNSINLFRNFDFRYGQEGATHTKNPDWLIWTYYHGVDGSPESEPEVQALLAAWDKFLPRHYIDMHVGSSDKKLWFTWLPDAGTNETDAQNKQMMIDKNPAGKWIKVGNANWKNIQGIRFEIDGALNVNTVNLDGLHFGHARFRYMAEDTESPYELRERQETDDELYSNHECEMRAKALLDWLKGPLPDTITLKLPNLNYGMTPILAADKIHVHLPNEDVDADYVVNSAEYEVVGADNSLLVTLECGKGKLMMADYVFANMVMLKKLQKYKQTGAGSVG